MHCFLDHIAYRVKDRKLASLFFIEAFGYKVQAEFDLCFDDGTKAACLALEPPQKLFDDIPMVNDHQIYNPVVDKISTIQYHIAHDIFISDGESDSIVGRWVNSQPGGNGGVHHLAYFTNNIKKVMDLWKEKGWAEFSTEEPLTCPGLTQVFTKVHPLTNVIYELINRKKYGFCSENVKRLMISTDELKNG